MFLSVDTNRDVLSVDTNRDVLSVDTNRDVLSIAEVALGELLLPQGREATRADHGVETG